MCWILLISDPGESAYLMEAPLRTQVFVWFRVCITLGRSNVLVRSLRPVSPVALSLRSLSEDFSSSAVRLFQVALVWQVLRLVNGLPVVEAIRVNNGVLWCLWGLDRNRILTDYRVLGSVKVLEPILRCLRKKTIVRRVADGVTKICTSPIAAPPSKTRNGLLNSENGRG